MFGAGVRKLTLTLHIVVSVGWLGAVAGFLALAIGGLSGSDPRLAGAAYAAMQFVTWWVIVPLGAAALASGVVQSLGTAWGLFRHYWVLVKLLLTALAFALLMLHTQPVDFMADVASGSALSPGDHRRVRIQLVANAAAAILLLIGTTGLSVYKPRGLTSYGQRRQHAERRASSG